MVDRSIQRPAAAYDVDDDDDADDGDEPTMLPFVRSFACLARSDSADGIGEMRVLEASDDETERIGAISASEVRQTRPDRASVRVRSSETQMFLEARPISCKFA